VGPALFLAPARALLRRLLARFLPLVGRPRGWLARGPGGGGSGAALLARRGSRGRGGGGGGRPRVRGRRGDDQRLTAGTADRAAGLVRADAQRLVAGGTAKADRLHGQAHRRGLAVVHLAGRGSIGGCLLVGSSERR